MMFFMRDLHGAYDGTVRNAYGNQLVQFSYNIDDMDPSGSVDEINNSDGIAGRPVGPLAACAISEAAYSALDQPISLLEKSPLLNLKVLSLSLSPSQVCGSFILLCFASYKGHLQMTVNTSISLVTKVTCK
jgi:DNA-directed RNA polymerase-4 subunit 1